MTYRYRSKKWKNMDGVRGLPIKLFQRYFQNRQQLTSVNNVSSHMNNINCGIPQGSTPGLLLFNIYIGLNNSPLTRKLPSQIVCR